MKKHIYYYRSKLYLLEKNYLSHKNFKVLKKNIRLKNSIRQKVIFNSFKKNFKINKNNVRKFCMFTGRLRSMVGGTKLNRLTFIELASKSYLCGIFYRK